MSKKSERYISNQEKVKTRGIYRIFKEQKAEFVDFLNKQPEKSAFFEQKAENLDDYLDSIKGDIPDYLENVLPAIMNEGAKESIARYEEFLPQGYALAFDIPGTPAAQYIENLTDLYLSTRDGSILKTTRDELRRIIAQGLEAGQSYWEIAKQIQEVDPFVFSKTRAKLIAVNEVGRAYGWANHEPARVLETEGFVLQKTWTTSHDDKVRETHNANEEAGAIPLDAEFPGTGDQYAPSTVDINCRCTSTHKIVAVKNINTGFAIPLAGKSILEVKEIFERERKRV